MKQDKEKNKSRQRKLNTTTAQGSSAIASSSVNVTLAVHPFYSTAYVQPYRRHQFRKALPGDTDKDR